MVAAPESIVQDTAVPQQLPAKGKQATASAEDQNGQLQHQGLENGQGHQGDGLTVVANGQPAGSAPMATHSSHNSNFDPTPASPNVNIPPPEIARNIPCRFFPLGTCKYGDQCAFSHGISGVAGSPGVPSTVDVQDGSAAVQQQQQQHAGVTGPAEEYSQEAMQGMPMYYPPMDPNGHYAPHFPPQGYYPYPPHFQQHYYQPPQQYYQHIPPPPQSLHPEVAPTSTPSPSSTPALAPEQVPTSPTGSAPFTSPPAPQPIPLLPSGPQGYAPYPPPGAEYAYHPAVPSSPTSFGVDASRPSLHTFFQTGAPPPNLPQAPLAQSIGSSGAPFPPKGVPRPNATAPRRAAGAAGHPAGVPQPFVRKVHPRPGFGTGRPACSFFEGNRCRHGDSCTFPHILPDGTDARDLGRNYIGVDGRTDNPELRGGMPPAWLLNQKAGGKAARAAAAANGGYPAPTFLARQKRMEEERAKQAAAAAAAAAPVVPIANGEETASAPAPAVETAKAPVVANGAHPLPAIPRPAFQGRVPGSGAPAIVAAIHGLTRKIPPVSNNNTPPQAQSSQSSSPAPAANGTAPSASNTTSSTPTSSNANLNASSSSAPRQRVPSTDDFPALSTPATTPSVNGGEAKVLASGEESVVHVKEDKPAVWPTETGRDGAPSVDPVHPPVTATTDSTPAPAGVAQSEHSDSDFVIITHDDASPAPASSTPAAEVSSEETPAPVVTPKAAPPRIVGSFASAAARGAAVASPSQPIRRPALSVPAKGTSDEQSAKEATPATGASTGSKKKGKKGGRGGEGKVAQQANAPVALKA
ncbi:hypothetical protein T439DRAFT_360345 [Meredithblackwellia eburnea MCA 4105]